MLVRPLPLVSLRPTAYKEPAAVGESRHTMQDRAKADAQRRLAEALRANLRRRKAAGRPRPQESRDERAPELSPDGDRQEI